MVSSREPVLRDVVTDTWCAASWEDFLALADDPAYERGRFYYHQGYMRIEMSPVGPRQGRSHAITSHVVSWFATGRNIRSVQLINCSFRKPRVLEFQPDLSYYIGAEFELPPQTDTPVDFNEYDPPALVVEVGATSISDDLGRKRLLYERAGVREYWVVDANAREAIAFEISQGRSGEIQESLVLPGLGIARVEEALTRSQTQDDGEINRWLLQTFMVN